MATSCKHPLLLYLTISTFFLLTSALLSEPDILLTFKASIKDPQNSLSTWSNTSGTHHCQWAGITCTATTTTTLSVTSLNLQIFNLSGDISPAICGLPYLSELNLADNFFNQPIPLHLSQCTSLETLNLSNNLIWGTILNQISQFGSLKVLDLSKNRVEGNIPQAIGALHSLQVLNLGSNLLTECNYSKKATEQMDVYSYGVVLLELVTGRPAEQAEPSESLDIVKWVRRKVNITNGAVQVLDPKIKNSSQQEILGALEIALCCTSVMPEKRPSMSEVVRSLQSLDSRTHGAVIDFSSFEEH